MDIDHNTPRIKLSKRPSVAVIHANGTVYPVWLHPAMTLADCEDYAAQLVAAGLSIREHDDAIHAGVEVSS
jgi:hypothetical protein